MAGKPDFKQCVENRGSQLSDYWPLVVLIAIAGFSATALSLDHGLHMHQWMHYFMGIFLCCFAMLKLFHPSAFADGFQMYDIIAKRTRAYAYIYPYIELALGLSYLAFFQPQLTYIATIILMLIGAVGVTYALKKGLDINCPCMGSILNVPLSTVTLTEDLSMAAMAAWMLLVI